LLRKRAMAAPDLILCYRMTSGWKPKASLPPKVAYVKRRNFKAKSLSIRDFPGILSVQSGVSVDAFGTYFRIR